MSQHKTSPAVCFVTIEYPPDIGGISRSAARIVRHLVDAGFNLHVFTPSVCETEAEAGLSSRMEDGVHVHRVRLVKGSSKLAHAYALRNAIQKMDDAAPFDLFHGFYVPAAFPCIGIAERGKRPIIASLRGSDGVDWLEAENLKRIMKTVLERADWVTSVSTDLLDNVSVLCELKGKSSLILNSIEGRNFPAWQLSEAQRGVVGTLGKFRYKKDIPLLIQAYMALDSGLRERLLLVGYYEDERTREECERLIERIDVSGEVHLTGSVQDEAIVRHLLSMNVFVMCSRHDGLPNALLEAAAVGVPLVATAVGGMRDVLVDGENALLVPPENQSRLTEAITAVLRDDALARKLSEGARQITGRLQPETEKRAWRDLYRRMIDGR